VIVFRTVAWTSVDPQTGHTLQVGWHESASIASMGRLL
jgi:hypothetical protein